MNFPKLLLFLFTLVFYIFIYNLIYYPTLDLCEVQKCPYCFGLDFCSFMENGLELKRSSLQDWLANYISVKNVYYADYKGVTVVLKKLGHNWELKELDRLVHDESSALTEEIMINLLNLTATGETSNYRFCSNHTLETFLSVFLKDFTRSEMTKMIWTTMQINIEPLLIRYLHQSHYTNWPVPWYLGACGRIVAESYCGSELLSFNDADWRVRAGFAMQLLVGVRKFTNADSELRFYLTDISPDNIAVDSAMQISFVDLENVIIADKIQNSTIIHSSEAMDEFAFSEEHICKSSISDHNYYAVCKLLLSHKAPWPMMEGGLLHSPPLDVQQNFQILFELIEECVEPSGGTNRFEIVENILILLDKILYKD